LINFKLINCNVTKIDCATTNNLFRLLTDHKIYIVDTFNNYLESKLTNYDHLLYMSRAYITINSINSRDELLVIINHVMEDKHINIISKLYNISKDVLIEMKSLTYMFNTHKYPAVFFPYHNYHTTIYTYIYNMKSYSMSSEIEQKNTLIINHKTHQIHTVDAECEKKFDDFEYIVLINRKTKSASILNINNFKTVVVNLPENSKIIRNDKNVYSIIDKKTCQWCCILGSNNVDQIMS
jgi:hypothetical protein